MHGISPFQSTDTVAASSDVQPENATQEKQRICFGAKQYESLSAKATRARGLDDCHPEFSYASSYGSATNAPGIRLGDAPTVCLNLKAVSHVWQ